MSEPKRYLIRFGTMLGIPLICVMEQSGLTVTFRPVGGPAPEIGNPSRLRPRPWLKRNPKPTGREDERA
jgi:hypothetical protein